jgi:hypothetical protein
MLMFEAKQLCAGFTLKFDESKAKQEVAGQIPFTQ